MRKVYYLLLTPYGDTISFDNAESLASALGRTYNYVRDCIRRAIRSLSLQVYSSWNDLVLSVRDINRNSYTLIYCYR